MLVTEKSFFFQANRDGNIRIGRPNIPLRRCFISPNYEQIPFPECIFHPRHTFWEFLELESEFSQKQD